jgi:hypothetical protein
MKKEKSLPKTEKKKYWCYIVCDWCVLCGRSRETRERRYTPRPEKWEDRHEYTEYACSSHF